MPWVVFHNSPGPAGILPILAGSADRVNLYGWINSHNPPGRGCTPYCWESQHFVTGTPTALDRGLGASATAKRGSG